MSTDTGRAILQLHVTRRCNLRCLHCYSRSSPDETDVVPLQAALDLVTDASESGYSILSVSGGEPFMYDDLPEVLERAKAVGMQTQAVSNGLAVTRDKLERVAPWLDLLAISIDGDESDHDRMRQRPGAFGRLLRRVEMIASSGVSWGFLFTLTNFNVHQLPDVAAFAADRGARLLQIHPLEVAGRAIDLRGEVPDEHEVAVALIEAALLRREHPGLTVHVDATTAGHVRATLAGGADRFPVQLADAVPTLVVEPDGTCVPFEFGFDRRFALGSILEEPLTSLGPPWIDDVLPELRRILDRCLDAVELRPDAIITDPYEGLDAALRGA